MKKKTTAGLLSWLVVCVGGGALVGTATAGDSPWYRALDKPTWTPPSWIFGPVWTLLYVAMALAAWRVWRRGGWTARTVALSAFVLQLGLNFAWSFIFFSFHRIGLALVDILLLSAMIVVTMRLFGIVDRYAAWLLAPYLGWVIFAAALNAEIYRLLQ